MSPAQALVLRQAYDVVKANEKQQTFMGTIRGFFLLNMNLGGWEPGVARSHKILAKNEGRSPDYTAKK